MLILNIRILLHEQYFLHKIEDRTIISCVSLALISSDDFDRDMLSWKLDFRRVWVFFTYNEFVADFLSRVTRSGARMDARADGVCSE